MTGELRDGATRRLTCPACSGPKSPGAALCLTCRHESRAALRKRVAPLASRARARLRSGEAGFGPICPACGGPKTPANHRCADCAGVASTRDRPQNPDSVYTISRRESIVTFRHEPSGALRTRVCVGRGRKLQIADGLARLPGDGWVVETISTPQSILTDLQKTNA